MVLLERLSPRLSVSTGDAQGSYYLESLAPAATARAPSRQRAVSPLKKQPSPKKRMGSPPARHRHMRSAYAPGPSSSAEAFDAEGLTPHWKRVKTVCNNLKL